MYCTKPGRFAVHSGEVMFALDRTVFSESIQQVVIRAGMRDLPFCPSLGSPPQPTTLPVLGVMRPLGMSYREKTGPSDLIEAHQWRLVAAVGNVRPCTAGGEI